MVRPRSEMDLVTGEKTREFIRTDRMCPSSYAGGCPRPKSPAAARPDDRAEDIADRENERIVRQSTWTRAMSAVVINPKGGSMKTPLTLLLAGAIAEIRGGGVAAWEGTEVPGDLAAIAEGDPARGLTELIAAGDMVTSAGNLAGYSAPQTSHSAVFGTVGAREEMRPAQIRAVREASLDDKGAAAFAATVMRWRTRYPADPDYATKARQVMRTDAGSDLLTLDLPEAGDEDSGWGTTEGARYRVSEIAKDGATVGITMPFFATSKEYPDGVEVSTAATCRRRRAVARDRHGSPGGERHRPSRGRRQRSDFQGSVLMTSAVVDPCDIPGVSASVGCAVKDKAEGAADKVATVVEFSQDPMAFIAQKEAEAAKSLTEDIIPALTNLTQPDLTVDWFIDAYKISFAAAIFGWIVIMLWDLTTFRGRGESGREVIDSFTKWTPVFIGGSMFGPAAGAFSLKGIGHLNAALISWGLSATDT